MRISLSIFKEENVDIDITVNENISPSWSNFVYMRVNKKGFKIMNDPDKKFEIVGVDIV